MTISAEAARVRPDWRFVCAHPAHFLAFGFGSGLSPKAPGTAGTLAALPLYLLLLLVLSPSGIAWLCLPLYVLGIWFCDKAGRALGVADHGGIVWDEIVAFLLVLALGPQSWLAYALGFGLFRLFDIWKPFPIRQVDQQTRGGFGVMLDDLLAAAYSLAALYGLYAIPGWMV